MCIIASIKSNQQISKATLKRCWDNNPHGGGFMFTDGKKVITYKEMQSFKKYYREFLQKREEYSQSNFVCHFRISTHGKINTENCHPFLVNDKLGFVHNGIIRNASISPDYSDTNMFNRETLQMLPINFTSNQGILSLIKEYIGSGSKLAFLSSDNHITYVNESAGQYDENGVWFSNGGYKEYKYYDAGGVKVDTFNSGWLPKNTTSYQSSNKVYYGSYKQSNIGFNGSTNSRVKEPTKIADINWNERLKNDKKIESDIVTIARSGYADKYTKKCGYCDKELKSYSEKDNGICFHCEDRYNQEWSF
jgi:glutamine amidotransferase